MKILKRNNKKGQDMIEAVIIIPIFFLILAFTINIAQILLNSYTLKEAVYSGARSAVVCTNIEQANSVAKTQAKNMLKNAMSINKQVHFDMGIDGGGAWQKGSLYRFKATATVNLLFPWMESGSGGITKTQQISQEMYMMIENQ